MPIIPFERMPDTARLWIFPASRALFPAEAGPFLSAVDQFLNGWSAHGTPLATAREWRHDRFLLVAVDESLAGASGCSVDGLVRFMRDAERKLGVTLTDNAPVWYRDTEGLIHTANRRNFQRLADDRVVSPDTPVFDNTIETIGALRRGLWEVPAARSWHGRVFFAGQLSGDSAR